MVALPTWALRLLKAALFVFVFYVLLSLIMLIGSSEAGPWEKAALGLVAAGVYVLAVTGQRIGSDRS